MLTITDHDSSIRHTCLGNDLKELEYIRLILAEDGLFG